MLQYALVNDVCVLCAFSFSVSPAVVEHVRDGCTLRTITVPSFQLITVAMSGIKVRHLLSLMMVAKSSMMDGKFRLVPIDTPDFFEHMELLEKERGRERERERKRERELLFN